MGQDEDARFARAGVAGCMTASAALAVGMAAIIATTASAMAQTAPAADEEITVTATRIARSGFTAPTPTTVVGQDELQARGTTNVANLLNEMPAFRAQNTPAAYSPTASQNAGSNFLNLRGIGAQRTLLLVDGRRHVPTTSSALVDLNAIPTILVDRVEVVTGGASAAWGSDAVAGVVNIMLDNKFNGGKAEAQYGISDQGDNREYKVGFAYGLPIGSRVHLTVAGEVDDNRGIGNQSSRDWGGRAWTVLSNPTATAANGQILRYVLPNVHPSNATEGGLITSGALAGTQFLAGGATAPFTYGSLRSSSYMYGGDGAQMGDYVALAVPVDRQNFFAHADFEVSDRVQAFVEASFARSHSRNDIIQPYDLGSLTISADNAFLPASVRNALRAANQTSFGFGRINTDMGFYTTDITNKTYRGVVGLKADLGESWKASAYYEYGETDYYATLRNRNVQRFNQSVDSVINAAGQPACRINADASAANDDPSCVPVNLFGYGSPSQAAIGYFMQQQWQDSVLSEHSAVASIQGQPFSTWAGVVSVVGGFEYRREAVDTKVDALSAANAFSIGNPKAIQGSYDTKEVYGETIVPLLANMPLVKSFDFNGAFRFTDYSTSGAARTWKIGATYDINDEVRLRVTKSRDMRAPNLDELYTTGQLRFATVFDPISNSQANISTLQGGDPNLRPETAHTVTYGFVYQPAWLRGLRASVDWYRIKVDGAIAALSGQDVVTRCANGNAALCSRITRNAAGVPTQISITQLNLSTLKTNGVDLELGYGTALDSVVKGVPGDVTLRFLATYVRELSTNDGVTSVNRAGTVGAGLGGMPHWRWNVSGTYRLDPYSFNLRGRYVGGGKYDGTYTALGINDNTVSSAFYVDAGVQFNLIDQGTKKLQLFANVNNLFNQAPPIDPTTNFFAVATNPELYDVIGRTWMFGARFQF